MRKIKVTEKNIDMLAGLIQKYFDSFKKKNTYGTEYDYNNWKNRESGSYTFYSGKCQVIKRPKCKKVGESTFVPIDNQYSKVIRIEFPVRDAIRVGDYVCLDGNYFMYGTNESMYQKAYFRDLEKRYCNAM
jgi:hypothetical protein